MAEQCVIDFEVAGPPRRTDCPTGCLPNDEAALDRLEEELSRNHRGRARAIKLQAISDRFGWDRRTTHDLVARLVTERRLPVGTTSRRPAGVFWCIDEEDRRLQRHLYTRAMEMLRRYRIVCRVTAEELAGQVRMELE